MGTLAVVVHEGMTAEELASTSRDALDRELVEGADGELLVATVTNEALVLGAFQRMEGEHVRRGSGGGELRVTPGTVWLQLALASLDAFVACPPDRILNRYVRPLLRALTKEGVRAGYFDRDWVSASNKVIAGVSFAHDSRSGRALFEAIIATGTEPVLARTRPTYRGKEGGKIELKNAAELIGREYSNEYSGTLSLSNVPVPVRVAVPDLFSSWPSTRDEAIGPVSASLDPDGHLRIGGELMASRDALAEVAERARTEPLDALIDEVFSRPRVALFGVRSLRSLQTVIAEAMGA